MYARSGLPRGVGKPHPPEAQGAVPRVCAAAWLGPSEALALGAGGERREVFPRCGSPLAEYRISNAGDDGPIDVLAPVQTDGRAWALAGCWWVRAGRWRTRPACGGGTAVSLSVGRWRVRPWSAASRPDCDGVAVQGGALQPENVKRVYHKESPRGGRSVRGSRGSRPVGRARGGARCAGVHRVGARRGRGPRPAACAESAGTRRCAWRGRREGALCGWAPGWVGLSGWVARTGRGGVVRPQSQPIVRRNVMTIRLDRFGW